MIEFFIPGNPPRTTFQAKKIAVRNNRPVMYDSPEAKAAKEYFMYATSAYRPKEPLTGPVSLDVAWSFQSKSAKPGTWKVTKPDCDNLAKTLTDVLTRNGFWADDAQVVKLRVTKVWSNQPGIHVKIEELDKYYK